MDLADAIGCCQVPVSSMDGHLEDLTTNEKGSIDFQSRIKVFFKSQDFQTFLSVQSDSSYAVPSVLHVVCNTLVGAYVSFWMVYDSSMEWSYRVRYVRFVGHVIPAL